MDISVVIPLLNESKSLPELEAWIRRVMDENGFTYEIIFIDDGSTDDSWEVIERLSGINPHVKAIKFLRNFGKSAALQIGFESASGDVVITMDADLQDNPEEIPALYRMITEENYDLVSGWKKVRHDPLSKTLPTKLFNAVTRKLSGIPLHDFNCGLKAYRRIVVQNIEVYGEMHRYIPVIAKWAGFRRIGEKVVRHQARKYGSTKFGSFRRFINGPLDLMSIMFVSKFGKRPMHLFGALGIVAFFIGFAILLYLSIAKLVFKEYGIADRPLFYFGILALTLGTQLFLTGFLAEMVARNSPRRNVYAIEKKLNFQEKVGS